MALLTVYLDESGTHDTAKITAIGGLMGTESTWRSIESKWLAAIEDFGLTWFHSADCDGGKGEFQRMPKQLRFALANRLARIIADHKVLPVWAAVVKEDWDSVVKDQNFLTAFPKPLHLCFRYCAQSLSAGSARLSQGSSVAVKYAEQDEYQDHFGDVWTAYRQNEQRANLNSFAPAASKDCAPLQAADLVAYEMYRDWLDREYGQPPPPLTYNIRKPLKCLRDGGLRLDFGGCYDAPALERAMQHFKETGDI